VGGIDFIMYRLCAPIFTLSAALILIGAFGEPGHRHGCEDAPLSRSGKPRMSARCPGAKFVTIAA